MLVMFASCTSSSILFWELEVLCKKGGNASVWVGRNVEVLGGSDCQCVGCGEVLCEKRGNVFPLLTFEVARYWRRLHLPRRLQNARPEIALYHAAAVMEYYALI